MTESKIPQIATILRSRQNSVYVGGNSFRAAPLPRCPNSGHPGADGPKPKVKIETSIFNQCPGFCLIVFCLHGYCIWMCEWMNNRQLSVLPGLRWILLLSLWGVRLEAVRDNLGPYIRRSTVRRSRVRRSWVLDIFQIFSRSLHSATTAVVSNSSFWNCWNLF